MLGNIDDLLPTAQEIQRQAAIREAEKAQQRLRWAAAADAEKRALAEQITSESRGDTSREERRAPGRHPGEQRGPHGLNPSGGPWRV